jgi:membrane associated rhomboid family serine protease
MLILHDGNPLTRIKHPWVNYALMTAMVAVFLLQLADIVTWETFAFFPAQLSLGPGLLNGLLGLVSHQFLHGNILHIVANLVALRVFGDNIEDALGHRRYGLFFLAGGAFAAMVHGLTDPYVALIGASGAISAVMAGYLLLHPRARIFILAFNIAPVLAPASLVVGFSILLNIAMAYDVTLLTGEPADQGDLTIAWSAHVGGFAFGLVLLPLLKSKDVPLFQPAPLTQGAGMRWLGRLIPSLAWPGDRPLAADSAAAIAASMNPGRDKLLVFAKSALYILLILVLMRYM